MLTVKITPARFYQYGWLYHMRHAGIVNVDREFLVTAASIGNRNERAAFIEAIEDVMQQLMPPERWKRSTCPASTDPCLQVADYCAWALQRKYERDDARSFDLIKGRISYLYSLWSHGRKHYY
jgi:hypothetical protein